MRVHILIVFLILLLTACSNSDSQKKINQTGEKVGNALGEFVSGMGSGVEKTLEINIDLPEHLKEKGVALGKIVKSSQEKGKDNLLSVYMIFEKDFKGNITLKVFDEKGLEMGRSKVEINSQKGDAQFIDFKFDVRTNIDKNCKIIME